MFGSLVDLFDSFQLHVSYTKHLKLFLSLFSSFKIIKYLIKQKVCQYLPGGMGGGSLMKKVTNGNTWGRGF